MELTMNNTQTERTGITDIRRNFLNMPYLIELNWVEKDAPPFCLLKNLRSSFVLILFAILFLSSALFKKSKFSKKTCFHAQKSFHVQIEKGQKIGIPALVQS